MKLARKQWLFPHESNDNLKIESDYQKRTLIKKLPDIPAKRVSDWEPGINLMTFLMYKGAYPPRKQIKKALKNIMDKTHNDWTVNNMILQGNKLCLIDWNDPTHGPNGGRRSTSRVLKAHIRLVSIKNPERIEHYFYNRLIKT